MMESLMSTTTLTSRALDTVQTTRAAARKSALAYVGLHAFAYERASARVKQVRVARKAFFESLVVKGEEVETEGLKLFGQAKEQATETFTDAKGAVLNAGETVKNILPKTYMPKSKAERLEEEKAELEAKLKKMSKTATKKRSAKTSTKKTTTKKVTAKKTVAKTPAPKAAVKTEAPAAHIAYLEDARRYDADVSEAHIKAIVTHLGIALQSQDGKFVACTDDKERDTVRDSWLVKKLGVEGTTDVLDAKVVSICEAMKADRMKKRPTFYYLLAKAEDKLSAL